MFDILTNETNLNPLRAAIANAEREILICSAWVRSETLWKLFDRKTLERIREKGIQVRIIIRLGKLIDVKITDPGVFKWVEELGDLCTVRYHPTLHAKLFAVDETFAMVGSFNLTGGGFGNEQRKGSNVEAGIQVTAPVEVAQLTAQFERIWNNHARPLPSDLAGFCLNETRHDGFTLVGIRPLESGQFVEIRQGNQRILGQVGEVRAYNYKFFSAPGEGPEPPFQLQETLGLPEPMANTVQGLASSSEAGPERLNLADVHIQLRLIFQSDGDNVKVNYRTTNRIAPAVGTEVFQADPNILESLFNHPKCSPAVLLSNPDVRVGLNPEELLTKHMAVFGTTGSGKSYFTKVLISKYLLDYMKEQNGRIIVLDLHGEYARDLKLTEFGNALEDNRILNPGADENLIARYIQSAGQIHEMANLGRISREQKELLNRVFEATKNADADAFLARLREDNQVPTDDRMNIPVDAAVEISEETLREILKSRKDDAFRAVLDASVDAWGKDVSKAIRDQIVAQKKREVERAVRSLLEERSDPIFSDAQIKEIGQALHNQPVTFQDPNLLQRFNDPGLYVVDMSTMDNPQARYQLAGNIMDEVFREAKRTKDFPTLIVVEEAHNFAPEKSSRNWSYTMMKTIASEGRKFRVGMIVVTQRPAYVSKDVLAQCSSQAIFRLINRNDIGAVEEVVEGISHSEVYRLPHYQQGQCIFTGVAIDSPVVVEIEGPYPFIQVSKAPRKNENIDFGTLGLKSGKKIQFRGDDSIYIVSSGNGTPGNGGLLVSKEGSPKGFLYSLTLVTRRLLGKRYRSNMDIFEWWSFKGKTLREIHAKRKK